MMKVSKTLLYCCKAKPFLTKEKSGIFSLFKNEKEVREDWEIYTEIAAYGKHSSLEYDEYFDKYILNGSICFECECKKAYRLENWNSNEIYYFPSFCTDFLHNHNQILEKTKLSNDELVSYGKGKNLYAYHPENVKSIDPMPITELYKDEDCTKPLTRAPHGYCFAYEMMVGDERFDDWRKKVSLKDYWREAKRLGVSSRKVLVFSIPSPRLCKIANGEIDLDVLKNRIANGGIEYK
jgi:hypothetical protein